MSKLIGNRIPVRGKSGCEFYTLLRSAPRSAHELTAIDLFCGAGGLTLGLMNAGFDVRLGSDSSEACGATHSQNFPPVPFHLGDIRTLSPQTLLKKTGLRAGELDVLAGGPPCQGFSIIGERNLSDPRNALFRAYLEIARTTRPKAIVMENVTGLATMRRGAVLRDIAVAFEKIGYTVSCAELLAAQYGVPQMRWRLIFIGWRNDGHGHLKHCGFPQPTHGDGNIGDLLPNRTITQAESAQFLTTFDAISDLPKLGIGQQSHVYAGKPTTPYQTAMRSGLRQELYNHYAPNISDLNVQRIAALRPGQDWRDLPHDLLTAGLRRALRKDHTRRYRRMTWDGVPRSIITKFRDPKSGEYSHPDQDRTISIREAARIQSFPDWFEFCGSNSDQYEQVGNAVPPLLGRAVGHALRAALIGGDHSTLPPRSRYRIPSLEATLFPDAADEVLA